MFFFIDFILLTLSKNKCRNILHTTYYRNIIYDTFQFNNIRWNK